MIFNSDKLTEVKFNDEIICTVDNCTVMNDGYTSTDSTGTPWRNLLGSTLIDTGQWTISPNTTTGYQQEYSDFINSNPSIDILINNLLAMLEDDDVSIKDKSLVDKLIIRLMAKFSKTSDVKEIDF